MNVYKRKDIPQPSLANNYKFDYKDAYECVVANTKSITPDDIQIAFWTIKPKWLNTLFKLRNLLVKPFGLKGEDKNENNKFEQCIRNGTTNNLMSVVAKSENETVLCLNDKHLKAYLSVYIEKFSTDNQKISIITLVEFHNWLGYVYFYAIYPFHHIVVRSMLRNTLNRLLENDNR